MKKMIIAFLAVSLMSSAAFADWSLGFSFGRNYRPQMSRPSHERIYFPPTIYRPMIVPQYDYQPYRYDYQPYQYGYQPYPVYVQPYRYTSPGFMRYDFDRYGHRSGFSYGQNRSYGQSRSHFGR